MHNLAVIAQIDVTLQTLQQRVVGMVQVAVVDDEGIELIARLEASHTTEETAS